MKELNVIKDSIIGTDEQKIAILTYQRDLRTDQVVDVQSKLTAKEVECKKLHRLVIFWQVVSGLIAVVAVAASLQ